MENKVFYRLYQDEKSHVPMVKELTSETELQISDDKFATPYRYANADQAERAMVSYVRISLGLMGVRVL